VKGADGFVGVVFVDHEAHIDFARALRNHPHVDVANGIEDLSGHAVFAANIVADQADQCLFALILHIGELAEIGGERVAVSAEEFRREAGPTVLRSLRLRSAKLRSDGVEFEGTGSGHGVGLCQWGARIQAEAGRRYENILEYYFPGSTLSVVDE